MIQFSADSDRGFVFVFFLLVRSLVERASTAPDVLINSPIGIVRLSKSPIA